MQHTPVISGKEAVKAFIKAGWVFQRRSKKNHFILGKPGVFVKLSVPDHPKLDRGLLDGLIEDAGINLNEFRQLLDV